MDSEYQRLQDMAREVDREILELEQKRQISVQHLFYLMEHGGDAEVLGASQAQIDLTDFDAEKRTGIHRQEIRIDPTRQRISD